MSKRNYSWLAWTILILCGAALFGFGLVLFASARAAAFERVTGKHISKWDAMLLDLRVQEPAR